MELRQVKETMKELGLDRYHNPVVRKRLTLANKKKVAQFAAQLIDVGLKNAGINYRVNIFILNNDGTFTIIYNSFGCLNIVKEVDKDFVAKYEKLIRDQGCVVVFETDKGSYEVVETEAHALILKSRTRN